MYRRPWTGILNPTAATRGYGRVFKFRPTPNPRLRQGLLAEIRQKRIYSIVDTTWYIIVLF